MIAYLRGNIALKTNNFIILDVQGVGYKVVVSEKTFSSLPDDAQALKIYTYLHSREETIELYGFLAHQELELFELLLGISGIGPRTALELAVIGSLDKLKIAIEQEDAYLKKVKGLGLKRLQKIILEITGKIKNLEKQPAVRKDDDALEALVALGFSKDKSKAALDMIGPEVQETNRRIQEALKFVK